MIESIIHVLQNHPIFSIMSCIILGALFGHFLFKRNTPSSEKQDLSHAPNDSSLPPFHVREEKIRRGSSSIKNVIIKIANVIQRVNEVADTSSSTLKKAKTGIEALDLAEGLREGQNVLLSEIDRVITSNHQLKEDLEKAKKTLDAQKKEIESLRHASQIDHLTQVANRSFFDDSLKRAIEQFKRYGDRFSLIMIDIDYFKKINDTYGHQIGDHILLRVAQKINKAVRINDLVARYGGEEFSVILIKTDINGAASVAEELRKIIDVSEFNVQEHKNIPVTISLGVASVKEGDTSQSIVKRADKALYNAKQAGRNCYKKEA